jgi:atypical dual specificity phosphatase
MSPDRILPNLFVGSCPTTVEDIARLKRDFGVTAVLSVQTDEDLDYWGIGWDRMQACYEQLGMEIRRVPVRDFDPDDLRGMLPECVGVLDELLRGGHTVFLHCNAGVNRSPTIAIACLCWIEGWTLEKASAHVIEQHPCDPYLEAISLADADRREGREDCR